jgi:hypothetical protein
LYLFRAQRPGDVTTMPDLLNRCQKRDLAAALEMTLDLAMQSRIQAGMRIPRRILGSGWLANK